MSESREIITMRMMSWEKIKGELVGLKHTYWGGQPQHMGGYPEHEAMTAEIDRFIKKMDDEIIG